MTTFKKIILIGLLSSTASVMVACSDNDDTEKKKTSGDHVWKTQTDALKSAKDMAGKLQEGLEQQQEILNEND